MEARAFTSVCDNGKETDATRRLDEALSKINDFIATNSIVPISRDELEKVYQDRLSKKLANIKKKEAKSFAKVMTSVQSSCATLWLCLKLILIKTWMISFLFQGHRS